MHAMCEQCIAHDSQRWVGREIPEVVKVARFSIQNATYHHPTECATQAGEESITRYYKSEPSRLSLNAPGPVEHDWCSQLNVLSGPTESATPKYAVQEETGRYRISEPPYSGEGDGGLWLPTPLQSSNNAWSLYHPDVTRM